LKGKFVRNIERLIRVTEALSKVTGRVATYLVFALMLVMTYEVIARYLFGSPTDWGPELSGWLMTGFVALGGAYCLIKGKHVNVDMVYMHLSDKAKAYSRIITFFITFLFLYYFVTLSWTELIDAVTEMQTSGSVWNPVMWPVRGCIFVGVLMMIIQATAYFIRDVYFVVTGKMVDTGLSKGDETIWESK